MNASNVSSIFKAYDVRGKVGSELNPEVAEAIGMAFADWLPKEGIVAVGRDMRPDSGELANAFIAGLTAQGRDVIDLGEITSDMSYFSVGKYDLAGSAMVTASHNPGKDNGIKLYRDQVIPVGLDSGLADIRDAVLQNRFKSGTARNGTVTQKDIIEDWIDHCLQITGNDFKKYRVAIDAGNGMAGKIIPELEPYVPWDVTELFFDLDGTFPNHEANPQKPENMQALITAVREQSLDFGIAFDGDGDRAGFVDDKGRIVSGSDLISIIAHYYLKRYPGAEIIHEVRTSQSTRELIQEWGGKPYRTKAGRVSIGAVMRERNAPFGGETTGHLFFMENYYADSGLLGALMVIVAVQDAGKKLSELVDSFHRYTGIPEKNFQVEDKEGALSRLRRAYVDYDIDTLDGLSVEFGNGSWFNVRASNTEPLMRLNAEAKSQGELDQLVGNVSRIIEGGK